MGAGAQLTVTDMRRATRHPVDHKVIGEHRRLGGGGSAAVPVQSGAFP